MLSISLLDEYNDGSVGDWVMVMMVKMVAAMVMEMMYIDGGN